MQAACRVVPVVLWVVGVLMLYHVADSVRGVLWAIPFAFGPQAITHAAILLNVLLVALLVYFGWFTFIYVDAFYIHPDPQSAIALVFMRSQFSGFFG